MNKLELDVKCFYMHNNKVVIDKVMGYTVRRITKDSIKLNVVEVKYIVGQNSDIPQERIFSTREELLASL